MGRQTTVTIVTAAIALVNILLNFFLIPKYSFVGASIATLFSQALGSCIFFYYIYVLFPTNSYKNILVKMFCISLIFLIFLLTFNFISTYISAILSLLFYIIMILTLKILPEEEISSIKSYIKKFFSYNSKI